MADYEYFAATTHLKTVTYPDGSKFKFEYTTISGKTYLTTVKDALDNILETHQYDTLGRATTSERHGGVESYSIDYTGQDLTTVTDALGRVTKYTYSPKNGQTIVTEVEGQCGCGGSGSETTSYGYDSIPRLISKTDALGRITEYKYNQDGDLTEQIDPLGTQKWTYNVFGEVLTYKDRLDQSTPNNTVENTYDANGNLLTTKNALGHTTTLTYTALGQPATLKDARNNTTTLTYDTQDRLIQVKDANDKFTDFGYDAGARVVTVTNALSETTSLTYDLNNRPSRVNFPDTNYIEHTYDLAGRRTATRDARGNNTTYSYDSAYRLESVTDPLNHVRTFGYDLMSNMASQTDALGNVTNFEYDDFNRLKKIIYPPKEPGAVRLEERVEYDKLGNVKKRIDTANRETLYDYDNSNRLTKITDPLTNATEFTYNLRSHLTKVKDALNQEYIFTYDPLGRTLSETRAGTTMSYLYDAVGNRTKRTDHGGRVTDYEYDVLNRLKKVTYASGAPNTALDLVSNYTYDDLSRLATAVNGVGTVSFTYDSRGRLKTETDVHGKVIEFGYDANGNRNLLKLDGSSYAAYVYDNANRLTTLTSSADSTNFTYGYDNADRMISRTMPNGVNTTYSYDGMSRLTRLKDLNGSGGTLFDRVFAYHAANQIASITEPLRTRTFGYDNLDRLTSVTDATQGNESYAYDAVGNRTSSHITNTYGYQPFNRLTSTQTAGYAFDPNGNTVSKSEGSKLWRYVWDYENRLARAANRKMNVAYKYDALGRRVEKNLGYGRERTKYTHDGQDVLLDNDTNTGITKYQNGPGIDNKLSVKTGSTTNYFLADHLGSTNALTDNTGALVSSASYDSFGNPTGNLQTRYQYTGREYDNFTGLIHYRARMYDPALGRFTSEDPIGFAGGDVNLYGYVWNNPVNFDDPTGLFPENPYDLIPESGWVAIAYTGNFAAGFGDNITAVPLTDISLTEEARKFFGSNDVIDKCSNIYSAGGWTGIAAQVALGAAGGLRAAGTRGAGKEFSHWIPKRLGGPRSRANGNYVEIAEHALSDPHRYRFMPRSWKSNNPLPNAVVQQWNRVPKVYKGGAAGAAVAATRSNNDPCGCQ